MNSTYRIGSLVRLFSVLCIAPTFAACASVDDVDASDPEDRSVDVTEQPVINGYSSNAALHPYEALFVRVATAGGGCSGTLLGNANVGSSAWVLTASHCFPKPVDVSKVRVIRGGTTVYAKNVYIHPDGTLDTALIELKSAMTSSNSVYFTNLTPTDLVGTSVRCFGYGNNAWVDSNGDGTYTKDEFTGFGTLRWGDFTVKSDSADNATRYFQLKVPNGVSQALAPGDSGGPCIKGADVNSTSGINIAGILKAGTVSSSSGIVTYNREIAASAFSAWVRTYVPRPAG
ncbi:MAG: trypsin-like serine protease [Polyangiaceae bacterium]